MERPVDADIIAGFRENFLRFRPHAEEIEILGFFAKSDDFLFRDVDAEFGGSVKVNFDVVFFTVDRLDVPSEISRRIGEGHKIVGKIRVGEDQIDFDARVLEGVGRRRRENSDVRLIHRFRGVDELTRISHQAEIFTVDADVGRQRVDVSRPVYWKGIGEFIRIGPDRKIGVDGDKRNRRSAQGVVCNRKVCRDEGCA